MAKYDMGKLAATKVQRKSEFLAAEGLKGRVFEISKVLFENEKRYTVPEIQERFGLDHKQAAKVHKGVVDLRCEQAIEKVKAARAKRKKT